MTGIQTGMYSATQCITNHDCRILLLVKPFSSKFHNSMTIKDNIQTRCLLSILTLLSYSMVQSPYWEANWFAASQEILRISRNPKVHYRTHKRPPPVSFLGQPNPVHIPTSHLLEIHPNIIHPSTPRSPQWSLPLRFPHQEPIHPLSSPIRAILTLREGIARTAWDSKEWICCRHFKP